MKNRELQFKTKFWRDAAARLPMSVRVRHLADLQHAERMELAISSVVDAVRRVKNVLARRPFHTPRSVH